MRRSALVLVAVVVGLAGAAALGADPGDEPDLRVASFNLCGNVCRDGDNRSADFVVALARRDRIDVLLLQEACRSQAERVERRLGSGRRPATAFYVTTYDGDLGGANRCPGDDYGLAIVTTLDVSGRDTIALPNPGIGGRQIDTRTIACITVEARNPTQVCNTHLVRSENDASAHRLQLAAFTAVARRLADAHRAVIVGGDLNAPTAALGSLTGAYRTDDPHRAIDHVLASRREFAEIQVAHARCRCSDHAAVVASLRYA